MLAGVLAALAVATIGHTLVSSIRRRRRELAVLKTIGFHRRQVSAVVAWQATTFAALAALIGLPLGVALGRVAWRALADELGIVPDASTPCWGCSWPRRQRFCSPTSSRSFPGGLRAGSGPPSHCGPSNAYLAVATRQPASQASARAASAAM